jgi:hypothetical protein
MGDVFCAAFFVRRFNFKYNWHLLASGRAASNIAVVRMNGMAIQDL